MGTATSMGWIGCFAILAGVLIVVGTEVGFPFSRKKRTRGCRPLCDGHCGANLAGDRPLLVLVGLVGAARVGHRDPGAAVLLDLPDELGAELLQVLQAQLDGPLG